MAELDNSVAGVVNKINASGQSEQEKEDALLEALDDDSDFESYREQRLQSMHEEFRRQKEYRGVGHGTYDEIKDEKRLMDITTSTKLCVVHFWKPDFQRCRILDSHLETLAPLHLDTRFLRIDVANASFLVTKMKIQVLPCLVSFVNGIGVDRVLGFEGVGSGTDRFNTRDLESRLHNAGVLTRPVLLNDPSLKVHARKKHNVTEDMGDDWD